MRVQPSNVSNVTSSDDIDGPEVTGAKDGATPTTPNRNILSEHHSAQVKPSNHIYQAMKE